MSISGIVLTSAFASHLAELLEPVSPALGSVSGRLDALSVHNQDRFTLYPLIVGEDVECFFKRPDLKKVLDAVGRRVTVFGRLHYAKTKAFPVKVDVEEFHVEPPDSELPSLLKARGMLRNTTTNQRAWRDDWD
jgi:hypothetical protein